MPNLVVETLREANRRITVTKASAQVTTIAETASDVRLSFSEGTTAAQIRGIIFQVANR